MVFLMADALIRFTFIISKLLFTIVVAVPLLCSGLPRLLGFAKRNRSRYLSGKIVSFCSKMIYSIILEHFCMVLVTRTDDEDESFIKPSGRCDCQSQAMKATTFINTILSLADDGLNVSL